MIKKKGASSGHKLGQLVGDWFEEKVATYLLTRVANELNLFLDHRFKDRDCRSGKIIWEDLDGNNVDYDFVLELGGSNDHKGIPLAFFETFWRRGARHSKDKARDDSGKLVPMRNTYPTARILGIISAGDFTRPAQELVQSRGIDLFYIPKANICEAWEKSGVQMDYADGAPEEEKRKIANFAVRELTDKKKDEIFSNLLLSVGRAVFTSYVQRIIAGIAAIPIEYRITSVFIEKPVVFSTYIDAESYLKDTDNIDSRKFEFTTHLFRYEAVFSEGNIFERDDLTASEALKLHSMVGEVADYFTAHYEDS